MAWRVSCYRNYVCSLAFGETFKSTVEDDSSGDGLGLVALTLPFKLWCLRVEALCLKDIK